MHGRIFMCQDSRYYHIAIPFYADMVIDSLGMDSAQYCFDKKLFNQHAPVHYKFNSIGYRTHPVCKFISNPILVLGDSFTLGLGNHEHHRFSNILEQQLAHQVLNFSLNGASNDWICRKLHQLLAVFDPSAIVIHYTFSHRRERPQSHWHDNERTECEPLYTTEQNFQNWYHNFQKICTAVGNTKLVHSFIPGWHDAAVDYTSLSRHVLDPITQLDFSRDGFHYGPQSHQTLANAITNLLAF